MSHGNARYRMTSGILRFAKSRGSSKEVIETKTIKDSSQMTKKFGMNANEKDQNFISRMTPGPGLWVALCNLAWRSILAT